MLCVVFVVVRRTPYDVYGERGTTSMTTAVRCVRRPWYDEEIRITAVGLRYKGDGKGCRSLLESANNMGFVGLF